MWSELNRRNAPKNLPTILCSRCVYTAYETRMFDSLRQEKKKKEKIYERMYEFEKKVKNKSFIFGDFLLKDQNKRSPNRFTYKLGPMADDIYE